MEAQVQSRFFVYDNVLYQLYNDSKIMNELILKVAELPALVVGPTTGTLPGIFSACDLQPQYPCAY
ncbi:hypothetical protein Dfer_2309 [Dyadobacter fermentans DSM 18053]|uniref:Uncharacterized protein n=1 Tax=Dyadobacter fermentans (strain ATCC 700827 / DSM 18053 / CIP 107007 / KCTC 52180 / NS114) TaxID=471854 RepID=C6VZQ0_DYAFD|nr:hypothetical protein Dfer_2309 [Dyadobacter fermentans DSM 18053]